MSKYGDGMKDGRYLMRPGREAAEVFGADQVRVGQRVHCRVKRGRLFTTKTPAAAYATGAQVIVGHYGCEVDTTAKAATFLRRMTAADLESLCAIEARMLELRSARLVLLRAAWPRAERISVTEFEAVWKGRKATDGEATP